MGQSQDKIVRDLLDLQPTAILELFIVIFNYVEDPTSYLAFHGGSNFGEPIVFQGVSYLPVPIETEGFEVTSNGQMARPKIRISNKDYLITDLLLKNKDFQFARVIRKRTFLKYIDDINFRGGNPFGKSDSSAEISNDTFVVSQKTAENKLFVELELTSPLDLENTELNNRLIVSRYCSWSYRGYGCGYKGPPIETEEGFSIAINQSSYDYFLNPTNENKLWKENKYYLSGDAAFLYNTNVMIEPNIKTDERELGKVFYIAQQSHLSSSSNKPSNSNNYWLKDGCSKKLSACSKRFGGGVENNLKLTLGSEVPVTTNVIDFQDIALNNNVPGFMSISNLGTFYKNNFTLSIWTQLNNAQNQHVPFLYNINNNQKNINTADSLRYSGLYLNFTQNNKLALNFGTIAIIKDAIYNPNGSLSGYRTYEQVNTKSIVSNEICGIGERDLNLYIIECVAAPSRGFINIYKNKVNSDNDIELDPIIEYQLQNQERFIFASNEGNAHIGDLKIGGTFSGTSSTINGSIGTINLWSKILSQEEKEFLYKTIDANQGTSNPVDHIPRYYGEFSSEMPSLNTSLIGFWNMSPVASSFIPNLAGMDNTAINFSGLYFKSNPPDAHDKILSGTLKSSSVIVERMKSDWMPFGGFPGTEKYGFNASDL